jgi:hypothetical protein
VSADYRPNLATTGIGSVPFTDAAEAVSFVLKDGPTIPFWPQLPKRSFEEEMIPQYGAGVPCVRIDAVRKTVSMDLSRREAELEEFYNKFIEEDPGKFAMPGRVVPGLYEFERAAGSRRWPIVKGQTTGPVTFCTGVFDPDKRPLFGDPDLRDAVVKTIVRRVQWQIARLKPFASERVLVFVDEPVLAAFGSSSYLYLSEENVLEMLGEVFSAITGAGGITGIHVCGNSDWGVIVKSGVQVVNFDAYFYGESISLYPEQVKALFDRGGSIAWGIVPTTPVVNKESADSLTRRIGVCFDAMIRKGFSEALLRERAILTPSCGTGNLSADETRRVFELLADVRERLMV